MKKIFKICLRQIEYKQISKFFPEPWKILKILIENVQVQGSFPLQRQLGDALAFNRFLTKKLFLSRN